MHKKTNVYFSSQMVLALVVIFGLNSTAQAATSKSKNFTPTYKVEKCDCMGFSDNIPTFLSDLSGAQGIDIYGEGRTEEAAHDSAQNMCVETYRNFASVSDSTVDSKAISYSGCQTFRSTIDGEWEAL